MSQEQFYIPEPPKFSDEDIAKCEAYKDYRYIFFEYYKYVGTLVVIISSIRFDSPDRKSYIKMLDWGVLVGILSRIGKTISSQLDLAQSGHHRETITILDRCILESCLHLLWIINHYDDESVKKFISVAIKKDLELESLILENQNKNGKSKTIEERLLRQRSIRLSEPGIDEAEIRDFAKKFPETKELFKELGDNGTMYAFGYIMQSHATHGDWIGLRYMGYLNFKEGVYSPNNELLEFDPVQFFSNISFIFESLDNFLNFCFGIDISDFFEKEKLKLNHYYGRHNEINDIIID